MNQATRTMVGLAVVTSGALALMPERAYAGLDACGNIHVEAQAECVVVPPSRIPGGRLRCPKRQRHRVSRRPRQTLSSQRVDPDS